MNPDLQLLQPYPFEKLRKLKVGCTPPSHLNPINLSIGEPQHPSPEFILNALQTTLPQLKKYPTTQGSELLRQTISHWLEKRFQLPASSIDPDIQVLPVNGTREALFAFTQCIIDRQRADPLVLLPNPFYQIYEGATLLAGATPYFINSLPENGFNPDFSSIPNDVWSRCQLLYLCSPNNPTGIVLNIDILQSLLQKADEYDFIIAADECYSEIYSDDNSPPVGLLQACVAAGRNDFKRCIVFHSLSKRSNVPGLRSGFVAGDADILRRFLLYRTYHGCAMSPVVQAASIVAWQDEQHVQQNREWYRQKYKAVIDILTSVLPIQPPPAGFYLWLETPMQDDIFTRELFARQNVTVLPGSFLSRKAHGINPGDKRVRIALVASLEECTEAANRIRELVNTYSRLG